VASTLLARVTGRRAVIGIAVAAGLLLLLAAGYAALSPLYDVRDEVATQREVSERMLEVVEGQLETVERQEEMLESQVEDSQELLELQHQLVETTIPLQQELVDESIPTQRQLLRLAERMHAQMEELHDEVEEMNERTAPPGPAEETLQQ
jgi:chromosome segregation ATPase